MNAAKGLRFRHKMKPEELLFREFKVIRFALNEKKAAWILCAARRA